MTDIIIAKSNTQYEKYEKKPDTPISLEHIPIETYELWLDEWESAQAKRRREMALDLAASQVSDWGYRGDAALLKRIQRRQPLVRLWTIIHTMPNDQFFYLWQGDEKPNYNEVFKVILGRDPHDDESDGQLVIGGPFQWPDYSDSNLLAEIDLEWEAT